MLHALEITITWFIEFTNHNGI